MLYSVKMRAAQGAAHEQGGKHISGAERLVSSEDIEQVVSAMLMRARSHERGSADFINIKVSKVAATSIAPALKVKQLVSPASLEAARQYAAGLLAQAGISTVAISTAFESLTSLKESLRGALLIGAVSGQILNSERYKHGVRVSNMDAQDKLEYAQWLAKQGVHGIHATEAIVLASKVAACPDVVAELCWSDDPSYTVGYVNDKYNYHRIEHLKELGCEIGGRVFFVKDEHPLGDTLEYLRNQAVLIGV